MKYLDGFYYVFNFKDHFSIVFLLEDSIKSCLIRDCFKELLETILMGTIKSIHADNG